ncbi:hypothetical protein ACFYKX_05855 [Cytobacillus sp. FJAT-54145]|uniref:Lipoprotein n=1 Tax=Cytobacillus spartinae TaxID=3299023 RepID=A0ABW6KBI0_9BACI
MKKIGLAVSALTLTVGLAACSGEESQTDKKEKDGTTEEAAAEVVADPKKAFVVFNMELAKKINAKDADLNSFEGAKEEEKTPELLASAKESATATAEELKNVQIPSDLEEYKSDIEAALTDLADSYQAKAEELAKEAPSLDAANETFAKGDDKLGTVAEKIGLFKSSIGNEVN